MSEQKTHKPIRQDLEVYSTPAFSCSYLEGRTAVNAVLDPAITPNIGIYSRLVEMGFRRSGKHIYRPRCPDCNACRPSRVVVPEFRPSRSQKRSWKINQDLSVRVRPARHHDEYFELYTKYLKARHPQGGMESATAEDYLEFLTAPWSDTHFIEFRLNKRLLCVAVVDKLQYGYSSVYTFFDPDQKKRSLGVYAILWQIASAHNGGIPWVYLGYWIRDCYKMDYKADYKPLEIRTRKGWKRL